MCGFASVCVSALSTKVVCGNVEFCIGGVSFVNGGGGGEGKLVVIVGCDISCDVSVCDDSVSILVRSHLLIHDNMVSCTPLILLYFILTRFQYDSTCWVWTPVAGLTNSI